MRIIAGESKGRKLLAPKGEDTRPTLDRVKESLFGILQLNIPGATVLDLFAGSGSLGLEALSRGAEFAVFNDSSRECAYIINSNIKSLGYESKTRVLSLNSIAAIKSLKGQASFDIVFLDAPYQAQVLDELGLLFGEGLIKDGGLAVVEHELSRPPCEIEGLMRLSDTRKYGRVGLSFFAGA